MGTPVPMSVSKAFILESEEFKKHKNAGMSFQDNILVCLDILGMNINTLETAVGYITSLEDKSKMFKSEVYIGYTRNNFKYKYIYENISCLLPQKTPKRDKYLIRDNLICEDYLMTEEGKTRKLKEHVFKNETDIS